MKMLKYLLPISILISTVLGAAESQSETDRSRWHRKYDFIYDLPAITFHYDHGVLAGSYEPERETTEIRFDDVSSYLSHVCLCGAGGFRISQIAGEALREDDAPLEKGDFLLISSRDHTVSDVIAYVLGCSRRNDPEKNQYFIDESIEAPRREYHYYIGYPLDKKAVHVIYRKHLLIGNELMDRLWQMELAYDCNPADVTPSDMKLYQDTMVEMVREVLTGKKEGLFEVESIDYNSFTSHLSRLR